MRTTEKYALAQILVLGDINDNEFCRINEMPAEVQKNTIARLSDNNYLKHTLLTYEPRRYRYKQN